MKTLRTFSRFCAMLTCCLSASVFAQSGLKLEHDSSWEIAARSCTIRASQLANLRSEDTGPLFLSVYVRSGTGYDGVNSPGRLLARAPIGPLAANTTMNNIVVTTKARAVGAREQFTTLAVEEQSGPRTFTISDYVVYTSTYTFPRRQNGGVGSEDSAIGVGDITFRGMNSLTGTGRRADFAIEEIQNQRASNATGPLRLAIYATPAPYDGSPRPIVIATRLLGRLAQGDFYTHLQGSLTLKRPGRGPFSPSKKTRAVDSKRSRTPLIPSRASSEPKFFGASAPILRQTALNGSALLNHADSV